MKKQSGLSFYAVMVILLIVGVVAKAGIAIVPMYWDNRMLQQVLETMHKSKTVTGTSSVKDLHGVLAARIRSNSLNISLDGLVATRSKGVLTMDWNYEVKEHFMGNLYVVGQFSHHEEFE
ncbi:DUF4845 domain-containing protein [Candidatus Thalassolituus haligoni]|uniref:DUF4845 domain-containing protein n=1 Tax=Candidatus Thalassolituus haligoni TaxID=3100113 RepID=UPI003518D81C|tara:strand:+ start:29401 stop:29760 length:360 start_codon:yes stop_codon:yes gene_type:complete